MQLELFMVKYIADGKDVIYSDKNIYHTEVTASPYILQIC